MAIGWTLAPVYFVQEVGMDPLQLVLAGTFMEIAYFVFEVPTGVVADSYSRRASVIVAQVIMGIAFVATGLLASIPLILAAAALMGFGWTFKSGAIDAWLADEVGASASVASTSAAPRSRVCSACSGSARRSGLRSSTSGCRSSWAASFWSRSASSSCS